MLTRAAVRDHRQVTNAEALRGRDGLKQPVMLLMLWAENAKEEEVAGQMVVRVSWDKQNVFIACK